MPWKECHVEVTIALLRRAPDVAYSALPPYPVPAKRQELFLVLGELHHATKPVRMARPSWLTLPRRGLHNGIAIFGSVGTGKPSACMYPYVEQLLAWRAGAEDHKIGGLVLEVKGDFCAQMRTILGRHGPADDYIEI